MIVVDTNVVAYFWLKSPHFDQVARLYEADPDWIVPELCKSEFRNIAAGYLRKGLYTLDELNWIIFNKENRLLGSYLEVNSTEVMSLVSQSTCSPYDCEFVALAKSMGKSLVTYDKKTLNEFPMVAVTVEQFLSKYA
ncbi:MAG: type II toxin-antitoxin system VapC family toxin [Cyclobacteriaceae bacterium]|nr:MAG: type II toxin-antitoxin system VapC family toxin [Cyclobacteriaceae bacterium]